MDFEINLKGNVKQKATSDATAVDTLSAALKGEERALASLNASLLRQQAGSRVDISLKQKQVESERRLASLRADVARRTIPAVPPRARDARYDSTKHGALGASASKAITPASFKEIKEGSAVLEALKTKATAAGISLRERLPDGASVASTALKATAVAAVALVAVLAVVGSKILSVARDAVTMGLGFADSGRSVRLLNEAADIAGGTHKQLGGIIEDVRRRSDLGRERLGALARELRLLRFDSRQTQVTLSAMAVAESTLGQEASAGVKGIAEQSRAMRRFSLGARDAYGDFESLKKIGLTKADVFKELAGASGRSIGDIQRAVSLGQVSVTKGMTAIDSALRRKFGGTAQAQALSLTSQFRRMGEDFENLFTGSDMEPLLVSLKSITSLFSQDTASGRAFKEVVTRLMTDVGDAITKLTPDVKEFFLSLGAGAAGPGGLAESIKGWISDAKEFGATLKDVATAIKDIASAAKTVGGAIGSVSSVFKSEAKPDEIAAVNKRLAVGDALAAQGKKDGEALTLGIAAGVDAGGAVPVSSISKLADAMNAAFRAKNEIKSPSRKYARDAAQIPAGVEVGVERGAPRAVEAVIDMTDRMGGAFSPEASAAASPRGGDTYYQIDKVIVQETGGAVRELLRQIRVAVEQGPGPRLAVA